MPSFAEITRFLPIALTIAATVVFVYTLEKYRPEPASERYKACLAQAKDHPDEALRTARAWQEHNHASAVARHCEAAALFELKQYPESAAILEDIAHVSAKDTPDLAVTLLTQAADARARSNNALQAIQDIDYALTLAPDNAALKALQAQLEKK